MTIVREDQPLFAKGELHSFLEARMRTAQAEADSHDRQALLSSPFNDVLSFLWDRHRVDPIDVREESISADQTDTHLSTSRIPDGLLIFNRAPQVPATTFSFHIPFAGDAELFLLTPNAYSMNPPCGTVRGQELIVRLTMVEPDDVALKERFALQLGGIKAWLLNQRPQVDDFNRRLSVSLEERLRSRREKLLKAANTVAALGFPLRRREGVTETFVAPTVRRKVRAAQPTPSAVAFRPEPALSDQDYEHILGVIQSMTLVLERSPSAFKNMGEEDLRQHFLVQLNGHYEGSATAETFNFSGKTDILIREDDKNIFIAECKFWTGPLGFTKTIDQVLGYMSWRDTKAAIIMFNRDVAMSTVLEKIPQTIREHPNYKRDLPTTQVGWFRAALSHINDASRELTMTVLAFNVPGAAS